MLCEKCLYNKNCQFLGNTIYKNNIVDCSVYTDSEELFNTIREQAVKNTAREILDEVKSMFVDTNYNIDWIVNKLEKIAKKYGIEVK